MKKIQILFVLIGMLACMSCVDKDVRQAQELAERVMGEKSAHIKFEKVQSAADYYELESNGNRIVVRGNNANSMAVGLNHYLKNICNVSVSWFAHDIVALPAQLPLVDTKITSSARCKNRFFLNYCTFGYTMPWWGWKEWERLIDWMALNGVNMPLAITGQEAVWYRVWKKMGLTDGQIRGYFTGPAHLPWHRMSNVDYWEGNLPFSWLDSQEELQCRILERERALNMTPVLPAFAGHVPAELKTLYPDADIMRMSSWGGFEDKYRSSFLNPMDELFTTIQKEFLSEQTRLYGTDHVYGADPLNEVQLPRWDAEFLASVAKNIYGSMTACDPDAVWLQMTWHFYYDKEWTPEIKEAFMRAVPENKLISLDYYCENTEVWRQTESYYGRPYIWCYLGNFGGNTMLKGNLRKVGERIQTAFAEGGNNLTGIGSTLEALDVNPLMYEYLFAQAWENRISDDKWIERYADSHAGGEDIRFREAWQTLLDSVYVDYAKLGQGTITNSRPALTRVTRWTQPANSYQNRTLSRAWGNMLASKKNTGSLYDFDIVNVGRQVLGNHFAVLRDRFAKAYENRDIVSLQQQKQEMMQLLDDMDTLLDCHETFSLAKWIGDARKLGVNEAEKAYYEKNARNILTTWGDRNQSLNDYANRAWSGLMKTYYKPRWEMFCDEVILSVAENKEFDQSEFDNRCKNFEWEWVNATGQTPAVERPDQNAAEVATQIYNKYKVRIEEL